MKRIAAVISILLFATALVAQEPENKFKTKMIEVHNRPARDIALALRTLGSSAKGSEFTWNDEMRTITVRDYPENIAAIEEAIARLDKPAPAPADIEVRISLLIGSKTALPGSGVPDDLAPVVKQLQSTLRYSHYGLMATNIHHTRAGEGIEGSGVAEPTLIGSSAGMAASEQRPVFYTYRLVNLRVQQSGDQPSVGIENVKFGMRVPVQLDKATTYQNVGFETPVTIREGEKVVIGTTTMGDRAVIVVLMATVGGK